MCHTEASRRNDGNNEIDIFFGMPDARRSILFSSMFFGVKKCLSHTHLELIGREQVN